MRHWFIGDSVISRYGDSGEIVRVTAIQKFDIGDEEGQRQYHITLWEDRGDHRAPVRDDDRDDLVSALQLGQEWLP